MGDKTNLVERKKQVKFKSQKIIWKKCEINCEPRVFSHIVNYTLIFNKLEAIEIDFFPEFSWQKDITSEMRVTILWNSSHFSRLVFSLEHLQNVRHSAHAIFSDYLVKMTELIWTESRIDFFDHWNRVVIFYWITSNFGIPFALKFQTDRILQVWWDKLNLYDKL